MIIAIMGKTCTGKNRVAEEFVKAGYKKVVSYTTREPRKGEVEGIDYHFVSDEKFREMRMGGEFIETGVYTGNRKYGTTHESLKSSNKVVCIMTPSGVRRLIKEYGRHVVVVYLTAPLGVRITRYVNRIGVRFSYSDKDEMMNRIERDNGMFTGINDIIEIQMENTLEEDPEGIAEAVRKYIET